MNTQKSQEKENLNLDKCFQKIPTFSNKIKNNKCFDYIYVEETHIVLYFEVQYFISFKWSAKAGQASNLGVYKAFRNVFYLYYFLTLSPQ